MLDTLAKRAFDIRQRRTISDYYSLILNIKYIFFYYIDCDNFFIKTMYKISRYIAINLIIFIIKTLLLPWYLFLFNIFLNFIKLPFRNIFYIIKNRGSTLDSVYFNLYLFNKNDDFSKFFRKLNNFYKKQNQLDD